MKQQGSALQFAAAELRAVPGIVFEAVRRYGSAFACAAEELRADREVVFEAVKHDRGAIVYAAEELRLATRDVQLVADAAGVEVWVRCLSMNGEEVAVAGRKDQDGASVGVGPPRARAPRREPSRRGRSGRRRRDAPMAVRREDRSGGGIQCKKFTINCHL